MKQKRRNIPRFVVARVNTWWRLSPLGRRPLFYNFQFHLSSSSAFDTRAAVDMYLQTQNRGTQKSLSGTNRVFLAPFLTLDESFERFVKQERTDRSCVILRSTIRTEYRGSPNCTSFIDATGIVVRLNDAR